MSCVAGITTEGVTDVTITLSVINQVQVDRQTDLGGPTALLGRALTTHALTHDATGNRSANRRGGKKIRQKNQDKKEKEEDQQLGTIFEYKTIIIMQTNCRLFTKLFFALILLGNNCVFDMVYFA